MKRGHALFVLALASACSLDEEGGLTSDAGLAGSGGSGGSVSSGGSGGSAGVVSTGGASGSSGASGVGGTAGSGGVSGGSGSSGAAGGSGAAGAAGSGGTSGAAGVGGAAGSGGVVTIPSCADLYGQVVGVNEICGAPAPPAGQCRLAVDTDANDGDPGQPCASICADAGGECLDLFDQQGNDCNPDTGDDLGCENDDQSNAVCFCSQGCGGGPPCPSGTKCSRGACA